MLQSALDKAIKNENYEMASDLRDEMNRRKKQPRGDVGGVEAQNGKE